MILCLPISTLFSFNSLSSLLVSDILAGLTQLCVYSCLSSQAGEWRRGFAGLACLAGGGWLSFLDPWPQGSAIDSSGLIVDLGRCLLKLGGEI